jgi:hypothetical protein
MTRGVRPPRRQPGWCRTCALVHRLLLVLGAGLGGAGAAFAHGLDIVAVADGTCIIGRAWYDADTPARGDRVTLSAASAPTDTLASTTADDGGHFRLEAPPETRLLVVVEGEEDHVAEIAVRSGPAGMSWRCAKVPPGPDIDALHVSLRLAQALAGIGMLVGAAVAWAWWRHRRR